MTLRVRVPKLRRIVGAAAVVAAAWCGAAGAQPDASLGLLEAYMAARANDPVFQAAIADQRAGQEFEAIGRASLLPSISAVLSTNRNSAVVDAADGSREDRGDYTSRTNAIQLRQPLFNPEGWAARRQGIARAAEAQAQFRHRQQELIVRVFDAYSQALVAQEEVQLVRAQLAALDTLLQANEQRLRAGEGTRTEVLETSAKRALVRARLVEAQDAYANRLEALRALVGVPFARLHTLRTGAAARVEAPGSLEEWRRRAHAASAELESLRHAVTVAREEMRRLQSGHLPRLDLLLSAGRSASETTATFQQSSSTRTVGLQLNVPLYSGGAVSAQVRQAAALVDRAQAELDIRRAELDVELHRHYAVLQQGTLRYEALSEAVAAGEALVLATERSVAGGERTNVDVIDARERLAQARRDLARAGYEQLTALLRLRLLAGELDEAQLQALAARFVAG
ncbi:TolC family outer membrane protein [Ramlibacter sp. AN1015]|uniref:TolC family outer membrane protein n=1 Tax=Ramlibacter sp. AN1015 TaxID=3133428 RepID=UPI0030BF6D72